MAQLFDQESGVISDVPDNEATKAIASGRFLPPKGKLDVISANGEPQTIDAEGAQEAFTKYGYRLEHPEETAKRKFGDREFSAAGAAALRGATLGLSDAALSGSGLVSSKTLKGLELAQPGVSLAGEAGGALASLLIPGEGEANVAKIAGKLGQFAERGAAKALGEGLLGRLAAKGAAGAVEGSLYGAGRAVSEAALDDQELTAEKLLSGAGVGALVGLGGGVGLAAAGEVGSKALVLGKKALGGLDLGEAVGEFAQGRAAKAAGAERGTLKKLRDPNQAKEIGQDLLDLGIVNAKASQTDIREGVQAALKEHGEKIGATLEAADAATGGKAFDMPAFVKQAREEILPRLERDPAMKAQARHVSGLLDDYEALDSVGFKEANELKSSLQDTINFADTKARTKAVKKLQRIFDDQIETQLAAAGQDVGAYQEAGRLYGNLKEAAKWGKNQASAGGGNAQFGLRDVILGAAGLGHGGAAGLAMAAGSKLLRERGNQFFADVANRLANSETLQAVAGSFAKSVSGALAKTPEAFGSYGGILANAAARGPGDLFATHATLAQTDPGYVDTMARAGFAPESPEEQNAALRRANSLSTLERAVAAHDKRMDDSIKSFLNGSPMQRAGRDRAERRDMLTKTAETLAQLNANPQALMDRLRVGGLLADDAPGTGAALATAATKAIQFLNDKAPQRPTPGLVPALEKPWKATDAQMDTFGRYVDAVHSPASVLDDLRRGSVSKEAVEALQAVYPRLADDVRARLMTHLADAKDRLSYRQRVALAPLLGDQVGLSPGAAAVIRQAHQVAQVHEAQKQAAPGVAAQKRQMATTQTQAQRIESRGGA